MSRAGRWWRARQDRRRWAAEALVTAALHEAPDLSGWPIMERTGLTGARLYVALMRMEDDGRISSRWQDEPQPRRRLYRLQENNDG